MARVLLVPGPLGLLALLEYRVITPTCLRRERLRFVVMVGALALATAIRAETQPAHPPTPIRTLQVEGAQKVELHYAPQPEWQVPEAAGASFYQVDVKGETLRVQCADPCQTPHSTPLRVGLPYLEQLQLRNGGHLTVASRFPVREHLDISVESGGTLDAKHLAALHVRVKLRRGGEIQVTACASLEGTLRDGGVLRYRGHVRPELDVQQGGEVSRLSDEEPDACQHMVDGRDQKRYATVTIGEQEWFAENLAWWPPQCASSDRDCGVSVYGLDPADRAAVRSHPHYLHFGALYDWNRARSACPPGWSLPTDAAWQQLERHLGLSATEAASGIWRGPAIAGRLKAGGDSGLDVLLAGWRSGDGTYHFLGEHANFWTATAAHADHAIERLIGRSKDQVGRHTGRVEAQFSVRCVRQLASD